MPRKKRGAGRPKAKTVATRQSPSKQSVPEPEPESESDAGMDAQSEAEQVPEFKEGIELEAPPEPVPTETETEDIPESESSEPANSEPVDETPPMVEAENRMATTENKSGIDLEYWSSLLTEKTYLIDSSLGFTPEDNLKQPLKCFSAEDELNLFPMIETMSAELYNIVQKLNVAQKRDIEAAIKSRKGIIKIPNGYMKAYLCHINSMEPPHENDKSPGSKRAPHPFLLTEDENMFTEEKFKMLRAVLDAGWKREVVMRSPGSTGRKTGDVYYYSPDGTKFRSSKQVAQHLAELPDTPFTIENFSFAKVRISTNPDQEIVRKAYDGKPPPRAPPKPAPTRGRPPQSAKSENSKPGPKPSSSKDFMDMDLRTDEPIVKGMSSRRSIQPPKRYSGDAVMLLSKRPKMQDARNSNSKGLMQMGMLPPKYPKGMEDTSTNMSETMDYEIGSNHDDGSGAIKEIAEDSLFQISALRQSGSIDVDKMHQYVENQKKLALKAASAGRRMEAKPRPAPGGSKGTQGAVIPCSIRCPGMLGVIPNLQCKRCLCLFHGECFGVPPNLMFSKTYLCSNCTDQDGTAAPSSSSSAGAPNLQKTLVKKPSELGKRGPPGLAPLPHGHPQRGPVPGRDITVTLAGKEHMPMRAPPRVVSAPSGMARGMVRARGGPMGPQVRSPAQRMMAPEGSSITISPHPHPQMMRRGRGRPPSIPVSRHHPPPQMNRNLTITQLPRMQGPPPVPNLQPMSTPKTLPSKLPLPPMGGGKPRPSIAVPNLMKSNAFRVTVPPPSLSGRTFKKVSPPTSHQSPTNLRLNHPQGGLVNRTPPGVYTSIPDRSIPLVKRSPQTVCIIGNKKFVVMPKNKKARDFNPTSMVGVVGNGGLSKGIVNEGMATPESNLKKINNEEPVTDQVLGSYTNNDNATKESVLGMKAEEAMSVNEETTPINEQMLSYNDNENSQNSQQHGNGDVEDGGAESRTLTDVAVASGD